MRAKLGRGAGRRPPHRLRGRLRPRPDAEEDETAARRPPSDRRGVPERHGRPVHGHPDEVHGGADPCARASAPWTSSCRPDAAGGLPTGWSSPSPRSRTPSRSRAGPRVWRPEAGARTATRRSASRSRSRPAIHPRHRRHRRGRPDDPGRRGPVPPACTTAPSTTAPACGVAAAHQASDHPAADHAKAVMQVAAAGTGVRVSDGSTNVLPVGPTDAGHDGLAAHTTASSAALARAYYQGWDMHPAHLPTRYAATFALLPPGAGRPRTRRTGYVERRDSGRSSTSRPPPARWPTSCSGGSTAGPCRRARSPTRAVSTRPTLAGPRATRTTREGEVSRWASSWEPNRYGKAETRVVRIVRDTLATRSATSTSRALRGDFGRPPRRATSRGAADRHAEEHGVRVRQAARRHLSRGLRLVLAGTSCRDARVTGARVDVQEYAWVRVLVDGAEHDHAWVRSGQEVRTAWSTCTAEGARVIAGLTGPDRAEVHGLGVHGLPRTSTRPSPRRRPHPRDLADRQWRYAGPLPTSTSTPPTPGSARSCSRRSPPYSRALQQTLWPWVAPSSRRSGGRGDPVRRPEQAPLPLDLRPFGWRTPARSSARPTGPTG